MATAEKYLFNIYIVFNIIYKAIYVMKQYFLWLWLFLWEIRLISLSFTQRKRVLTSRESNFNSTTNRFLNNNYSKFCDNSSLVMFASEVTIGHRIRAKCAPNSLICWAENSIFETFHVNNWVKAVFDRQSANQSQSSAHFSFNLAQRLTRRSAQSLASMVCAKCAPRLRLL